MSENSQVEISTPLVDVPVSLVPSSPFRKFEASKINWLYEVTYLNEAENISPTTLPIVNPYAAFAKQPSSFSPIRSIRQLIHHTSKEVKEYV